MHNSDIRGKLNFLNGLLVNTKQEITKLEGILRKRKDQLAIIEALRQEFCPCPSCDGKGEVIEVREQDEVKTIQCNECHGSGTRLPGK